MTGYTAHIASLDNWDITPNIRKSAYSNKITSKVAIPEQKTTHMVIKWSITIVNILNTQNYNDKLKMDRNSSNSRV